MVLGCRWSWAAIAQLDRPRPSGAGSPARWVTARPRPARRVPRLVHHLSGHLDFRSRSPSEDAVQVVAQHAHIAHPVFEPVAPGRAARPGGGGLGLGVIAVDVQDPHQVVQIRVSDRNSRPRSGCARAAPGRSRCLRCHRAASEYPGWRRRRVRIRQAYEVSPSPATATTVARRLRRRRQSLPKKVGVFGYRYGQGMRIRAVLAFPCSAFPHRHQHLTARWHTCSCCLGLPCTHSDQVKHDSPSAWLGVVADRDSFSAGSGPTARHAMTT